MLEDSMCKGRRASSSAFVQRDAASAARNRILQCAAVGDILDASVLPIDRLCAVRVVFMEAEEVTVRKIVFAIWAYLLLIPSLALAAGAVAHRVEKAGMRIEIPGDMTTITDASSEAELSALGIAWDIWQEYLGQGVCLDAFRASTDGAGYFEIRVLVVEDPEDLGDYNRVDDVELLRAVKAGYQIESEKLGGVLTLDLERMSICRYGQAKWVVVPQIREEAYGDLHGYHYQTVYGGKVVGIGFTWLGLEWSQEEAAQASQVMDSIRFDGEPDTTPIAKRRSSLGITGYALIAAAIGTPVILLLRKKTVQRAKCPPTAFEDQDAGADRAEKLQR